MKKLQINRQFQIPFTLDSSRYDQHIDQKVLYRTKYKLENIGIIEIEACRINYEHVSIDNGILIRKDGTKIEYNHQGLYYPISIQVVAKVTNPEIQVLQLIDFVSFKLTHPLAGTFVSADIDWIDFIPEDNECNMWLSCSEWYVGKNNTQALFFEPDDIQGLRSLQFEVSVER